MGITALKQWMVLSNCYIHDLETKFDFELVFISIKAEYLVYNTKKPLQNIYSRHTNIHLYMYVSKL